MCPTHFVSVEGLGVRQNGDPGVFQGMELQLLISTVRGNVLKTTAKQNKKDDGILSTVGGVLSYQFQAICKL